MPAKQPVILITGGAGYIGSQLIRDLGRDDRFAGYTIRILDNLYRPGHHTLMNLPGEGRYQFLEGDILDPLTVRQALEDVSAVVHLAALVKTPFAFKDPTWTEQVNHWGTAQLVEACLELGVARFVFASSASVYGPGRGVAEPVYYNEAMPCTPIGAYAESKFAAEKTVLAASQRGLQGTVLRLGTVFGQAVNMRFDAVANHFAYLVGVGRPISVYGSGKQTRPLLHISDASAAIRFCLTQSETTCDQPLNVVGENVSILHLVETLKTLNPTIAVHYTEQHQKSHLSFAVNSQRFQALGWRPATSLQAGLADMLTHWTSFRSLAAGELDF